MPGLRDGVSIRCAIWPDHQLVQEGCRPSRLRFSHIKSAPALDAVPSNAVCPAHALGTRAAAPDAATRIGRRGTADGPTIAGVLAADARHRAALGAALRTLARAAAGRRATKGARGSVHRL